MTSFAHSVQTICNHKKYYWHLTLHSEGVFQVRLTISRPLASLSMSKFIQKSLATPSSTTVCIHTGGWLVLPPRLYRLITSTAIMTEVDVSVITVVRYTPVNEQLS